MPGAHIYTGPTSGLGIAVTTTRKGAIVAVKRPGKRLSIVRSMGGNSIPEKLGSDEGREPREIGSCIPTDPACRGS